MRVGVVEAGDEQPAGGVNRPRAPADALISAVVPTAAIRFPWMLTASAQGRLASPV